MVDRQFADDSASLARSLVDYPFDTGVTFPFLSLSPRLHTLNSDVAAPVFFSPSLSLLFLRPNCGSAFSGQRIFGQ